MHGRNHDSTKQHGGATAPHHPKAKGKKMIDVKTLSAQELSKKKFELSEKIKKTYVAKELAAIRKGKKDGFRK